MAVLVATLMCALGANAVEAYAGYTESNTTLTFYYDNLRSRRTGTTYDLNTGTNDPGWKTDGTYENVTQVVFDPSFADARPTSTSYWFYYMSNLQSITGIEYLNTSEVTRMDCMFTGCSGLTSLDVSRFNTDKVEGMRYMFASCNRLARLDLSNFYTSKVTDMTDMFNGDGSLKTIYVGYGWSTAAVTVSYGMFTNCNSLKGGQGTAYNTSNPKDATYAHIDGGTSNPGYFTDVTTREAYALFSPTFLSLTFYYDSQRSSRTGTTYELNEDDNNPDWRADDTYASVKYVEFDPSFADARPTTTWKWFLEMENLLSIKGIEYLNTSEVTNMCNMFTGCLALTSLDLSGFNTSKVTDMRYMFNGINLESLDLSSFNTSKVTEMNGMFNWCDKLQTIYVGSGWSTAAVTSSDYMFDNCTSLVGGQGTAYDENYTDAAYAHIDEGTSNPGYLTDIHATVAYACYTPSNTTLTFYYDNQRSSRTGTIYDLNKGDNTPRWYSDGTKDVVTQVVFDPSFADARPTTTYDWFSWMRKLESITGIEYLNTSEVTDMSWMFAICTQLKSLDVSRFNTSKVTNMNSMFGGCNRLTSLDLSRFNTSEVTNMSTMFSDCNKLVTIYVGDEWNTAKVTNSLSMFQNCNSLVGGKGTTYSSSNPIDKTYAHIDGGTSNPGYFTAATGIVTHIEAVPAKANTVKGIYTLDGRKLNELPTQKGIYIIDGRRVVIK